MTDKLCTVCGKPVGDDHYRNVETRHRECHARKARENRAANLDRSRAYDRERSSMPDRVAARAAYSKTPEGAAAQARSSAAYIKRNPLKRAAHTFVQTALRSGVIEKETCECCGADDAHAHHEDYRKPLDVQWLCHACHTWWHKLRRAG